MGADQFCNTGRGETAREAFNTAVNYAQYMNGHGGYTGTIAEKHEFVMLTVPKDVNPKQFAGWVMNDTAPPEHQAEVATAQAKVNDKWGPAGCIDVGDGNYIFLGWASS